RPLVRSGVPSSACPNAARHQPRWTSTIVRYSPRPCSTDSARSSSAYRNNDLASERVFQPVRKACASTTPSVWGWESRCASARTGGPRAPPQYCLIEIAQARQGGRRNRQQRRKRIIGKHLRVEGPVGRIK